MNYFSLPSLVFAFAFFSPLGHAGILEDRAIEHAIHSSYVFRQMLTDRSMVQVYVRFGVVELRGQVADEAERALLGYAVRAIPKVETLDNLLFVDSAQKRDSSLWRANRLRALLLTQREFDASDTRITYVGGAWEISGTVIDDRQRVLIVEQVAAASAADPVRVKLEVVAPKKAASVIDDPSVAAMVQCALDERPGIELSPGGVTSNNGEVILRGTVASRSDVAEASRLAASVRGVRKVDNRLILRG